MAQNRKQGWQTLAIHSTDAFNPTHAHTQPIYQSSTYSFESVAHGQALWRKEEDGYIYGRLDNPNTQATAATIAAFEGKHITEQPLGILAGSGMAAISTVFSALLKQGDCIVSQKALYGATHTLLTQYLSGQGVKHSAFDGPDLEDLQRALAENTSVKVVYVESPVNPTMALTDIKGVVALAKEAGAVVVVDNTFATPYVQRPLELGADVVVHSTTKYLTGHGTVIGGAIVTTDDTLYQQFMHALINYGGVAGPMDAWLTGQGLKTFPLRMKQHCENGMAVAQYLAEHPAISRVNYPGLAIFPQHELAKAQMPTFGAMMSFELKGGYAAGEQLMDAVELCTLAVSLGTVDTLIAHPASMMHFTLSPNERAAMGINDSLVRFSVGIEDADDIIADLERALGSIS